jgi:threonine dehydrogenase-like Zn-dependent dehydrogenase
MQALAVIPGTAQVHLVDRSEPSITSPDQMKIRMVSVGICGTDRAKAAGGLSHRPALMPGRLRWGDHLERLITNRCPHTEFLAAFGRHDANEIKVVLEWGT